MDFEIIRGNIAAVSADAIVLPANSELKEGTGASKAIFEAAGRRKLAKACKEIGCCDVGNAVPTLAFDLQAKYIIHAVVPKWADGEHNEYEMLCAAYLTALNLADQMKCKSIAFPLLSSGNNGFDLELAFEIARESINNFTPVNLEKIILVVFGYQITTLIKQKGFTVIEVPANVQELVKQAERHEEDKALKEDGKDIAKVGLDAVMKMGLAWLNNEENWKKIIMAAGTVFKLAKEAKKASEK